MIRLKSFKLVLFKKRHQTKNVKEQKPFQDEGTRSATSVPIRPALHLTT